MYYRVQTASSPDGTSHSFLGSVDFERGQSTTSFTLPLANDNVYRGNETFSIRLDRINVNSTYQNYYGIDFNSPEVSALFSNFTIVEDEPAPALSIDDVLVTEGDSGTKNAMFTLTMTSALPHLIAIDYAVHDGTAFVGSDYNGPLSGFVTIPSGMTSAQINVPIIGETDVETNETFSVTIHTEGVPVTKSIGTCTIVNDAAIAPSLTLSANDLSLITGATGDVFVSLMPPPGVPTSLVVTTLDSTIIDVPAMIDLNSVGSGKLTVRGRSPGTAIVHILLGNLDYAITVRVSAPLSRRRGVSH